MIGRRILFWLGLASCWWFTTNGAECRAADVDTDVSVRETVVGLPVILRIQISNSVAHEPPEFPRVDGLKIEQAGPPSRCVYSVANAAGFHPDSRCSLGGPWNLTQADRSSPRWSIVAREKILLRCFRRFLTSVGFRDQSVDRKVRFAQLARYRPGLGLGLCWDFCFPAVLWFES